MNMRIPTYQAWDDVEISKINTESKDYFDILKWAYRTYQDHDIVYACSFGAEGIVLIDLISKVSKHAHVVFLDTGLHFKETYELIEKVKEKYPTLKIELKQPNISLQEQENQYGGELWDRNPNQCCQLRKIIPLTEVLSSKIAWVSGLRREQSPTRKNTQYVNKDEKFKLVKICPLIHWKWEDVWNYISLNKLPYNELHDKNYPSIGCAPCTQAVINDDPRSGRWANHQKTECGLHLN